jgi:hypothetical protein
MFSFTDIVKPNIRNNIPATTGIKVMVMISPLILVFHGPDNMLTGVNEMKRNRHPVRGFVRLLVD